MSTPGVRGAGGYMIDGSQDGSKYGWSRAKIAVRCVLGLRRLANSMGVALNFSHHRELAATFLEALRGAEQEDARGNACEDPAYRADDADGAYGEADHRDEGAVPHACTVLSVGRRVGARCAIVMCDAYKNGVVAYP